MTYSVSKATDILSGSAYDETQPSELADLTSVKTQLSCLLEGLSPEQRDKTRTETLRELGLQTTESVSIFDEATQTVARSLAVPICILSVVDANTQKFKSVVGLSSLGLMNPLASTRSIPRSESFCTHVIDSGRTFALEDTTAHPAFSRSLLVQQYGIHAYLGVPLFSSTGVCIGTLAVMDVRPHPFTQQEVAILELSARWCMSEFEKQRTGELLQRGDHPLQTTTAQKPAENLLTSKIDRVRSTLLTQLTQDLRNPLTSITGMANMLNREIYGPLSEKQQEYTKIVLNSSQHLLEMVDEIVAISNIKEEDSLALETVDIEMVGQQAIASLESLAKQQELDIKLTVEPSSRLWNLDKRIIKQLIYHLVFSITKMSTAGSTIRLHISRKEDSISLALWVSNPWLGEDLPQALISWDRNNSSLSASSVNSKSTHELRTHPEDVLFALATAQKVDTSRQELGLLLSRYLAEVHGGEAVVQGAAATGYRYVITLPSLELPDSTND